MTQRLLPSLASNSKFIEKSFVFDSSDEYIRQCLLEEGWLQLPKQSNTWQLKWVWRSNPKDYHSLHSKQMINHFKDSVELTTKSGLTLLLKKNFMISEKGYDFSYYYPRSYNLGSQKTQFVRDFIHTGILNLLKKIIASLEVYYPAQYESLKKMKKKQQVKNSNQYLTWLMDSSFHWNHKKDKFSSNIEINGRILVNLMFYLENMFSLDNNFEFQEKILKEMADYGKQDPPFHEKNKKLRVYPTTECLLLLLHYYEKCRREMKNFQQDGFSNIWMIKSNYSSRGRGIVLIDDYHQIRHYDNGMKIIQKYIENIWILHDETKIKKYPFLQKIYKKKFDIRLWVLVKSFSPLYVYIFDEGYLRISAKQYQLDSVSSQSHISHLTNYTINWKKTNALSEDSYVLLSDFLNFLQAQQNIKKEKIKKNIDEIIIHTLRCTEFQIQKQSFQLFGFDVLFDSQLKPWLIECNMSPSCAERGELKKIVKEMGSGLLSLLGFIKAPTQKWRLLAHDGIQGRLSEDRKRMMETTTMNFSKELNLIGEKLRCKSYLESEKEQMKLEKVLFLQRFLKNRYRGKVKKKKRNCANIIGLLQVMARVVKKNKMYWLHRLRKRCLKLRNSH